MSGMAPTWAEFVDGWELFRDPILSAGIAGLVLGFLSVYIVLKRMIFVSASVTQGAGLGVALSFFVGIHWDFQFSPAWGAILMSLMVAGALVPSPERLGMTRETMLGLVFAFTGGATVLVGSRISQEAHDIQAILFGTGVLVLPEDVTRLVAVSAVVIFFHLWWFNGLTFSSFNPIAARVQGMPVRFLSAVLLCSVGVMIGVSARALGALPVFALTTMPGTVAVLVSRGHLGATYIIAAFLGAVVGMGGYVLSFFYEFPVGAAQTVLAAVLVAMVIPLRLARRSRNTAAIAGIVLVLVLAMLWHVVHRPG
jgi:zinc transport system permease protein